MAASQDQPGVLLEERDVTTPALGGGQQRQGERGPDEGEKDNQRRG